MLQGVVQRGHSLGIQSGGCPTTRGSCSFLGRNGLGSVSIVAPYQTAHPGMGTVQQLPHLALGFDFWTLR